TNLCQTAPGPPRSTLAASNKGAWGNRPSVVPERLLSVPPAVDLRGRDAGTNRPFAPVVIVDIPNATGSDRTHRCRRPSPTCMGRSKPGVEDWHWGREKP